MLRWSCSFMAGSWVTNPGDRQARPTSWMPRPSLAVMGRPVPGAPEPDAPPFERSSFLGRWRGVGSGEPGSFLTTILGGAALRVMLGGEDFAAEDCAPPRGLRLPRCAEEPDVVRWAVGEEADTAATAAAAADNSAVEAVVLDEDLAPLLEELLPKDGLSCGAGDGAMVMAVLIVRAGREDETIAKLQKRRQTRKDETLGMDARKEWLHRNRVELQGMGYLIVETPYLVVQ